jgi:putative transcriptional regulator
MSKAGEKVLRGAREALAFAKGEGKAHRVHKVAVPDKIDVASIRNRMKLSQQQFADRFGFFGGEHPQLGTGHPSPGGRGADAAFCY